MSMRRVVTDPDVWGILGVVAVMGAIAGAAAWGTFELLRWWIS